MKWNNVLKREKPKSPRQGQRYLVVIRDDCITEAVYEIHDDNPYICKWLFRNKDYQGEFVQMWSEFPDLVKFYNEDDFPTPTQITYTLSMANG